MVSENEFVEMIKSYTGYDQKRVLLGIGDDCAVVKPEESGVEILSTDSLVEGVHFDFKYFSYRDLAHKVLASNMSDIAAMGGKSYAILLSLGLPETITLEQLQSFYDELHTHCMEFQISIIGGNITKSREFWINTTILGTIEPHYIKARDGAQANDSIYVTGPLGYSELGRRLLTQRATDQSLFSLKHLRPRAATQAGRYLSEKIWVTSMMDISDGLLVDLDRIAKANNLEAHIFEEQLPLNKEFKKKARSLKIDPKRLALTGGEDYELLFTVSGAHDEALINESRLMGFDFYKIGTFFEGEGVKIMDKTGVLRKAHIKGFDHFLS